MIVAGLRYELHLPSAQSLKEKRSVLRPVVEGLKRQASVSVAEVDHQNAWQRAAIGVAIVGRSDDIDGLIELVNRYMDSRTEVEVLETMLGFLDVSEHVDGSS